MHTVERTGLAADDLAKAEAQGSAYVLHHVYCQCTSTSIVRGLDRALIAAPFSVEQYFDHGERKSQAM